MFTSQPLPGKEYAPEKGFADRVCTRFDHARVLFLNHALKLKTIPKTATCRPKLPLSPLVSGIFFMLYLYLALLWFLLCLYLTQGVLYHMMENSLVPP